MLHSLLELRPRSVLCFVEHQKRGLLLIIFNGFGIQLGVDFEFMVNTVPKGDTGAESST